MKSKKFVFTIAVILAISFLFAGCGIVPTPTPTKGTISGQVLVPPGASEMSKDISGWVPAGGAMVTVVDANGVSHTVEADEDGHYVFENLSVGVNTIITATVTIDGNKVVLKSVIDQAVSADEDYDAGTMTPESTALALVVEAMIAQGISQQAIKLAAIQANEDFAALADGVTDVLEAGGNVTTSGTITNMAGNIAGEIINPPTPPGPPGPSVSVTGVEIVQGDQTLVIGQTVSLTAKVSPSNASNKKVSWVSDDETVATVTNNGTVTAATEGTAIITVTTVDKGKTDSIKINVVKIRNITQGTDHGTIQGAVTAETTTSGDTILVGAGTYTEIGQIVIDKNLTIKGVDKETTIIKPAQDTGSTGDDRGWFLVENDVEFNLNNVTLDGENQDIFVAIYSHGSGIIEDNIFKNTTYPGYQGWGIAVRNVHAMAIKNNEFIEKGRIGVHVMVSNGTEIISNTFTGNGDGDHLQYGIEVNGAAQNILIEGNDFNYYGTSTTGWGSGAIFVDDAFKDGMSSVTINDNQIMNNEVGIYHGSNRGWPEVLDVEITGNQFTDNGRHVVDVSNDDTSAYVLDLDAVLSGNSFPDGKAQVVGKTIQDIEDAKVYNLDTGYIGDTIQEVIDGANDGDSILVGNGIYGKVFINKANLSLKSTEKHQAVIDAEGYSEAITVSGGNLGIVTVDGFKLQGWTEVGMWQSGGTCPDTVVKFINNFIVAPVNGPTAYGNSVQICGTGSEIRENEIQVTGYSTVQDTWKTSGIVVLGDNSTIENNYIYYVSGGIETNKHHGIGLYNVDSVQVTNNIIEGLEVGIKFENATNTVLNNNTFINVVFEMETEDDKKKNIERNSIK